FNRADGCDARFAQLVKRANTKFLQAVGNREVHPVVEHGVAVEVLRLPTVPVLTETGTDDNPRAFSFRKDALLKHVSLIHAAILQREEPVERSGGADNDGSLSVRTTRQVDERDG